MSDNAQITAGLGTQISADDVGTGATVTISNASPGVVTDARSFAAGQPIVLSTSGALPSPLVVGTTYYVLNPTVGVSYNLAATPGGAAINTTSAGSGTHTATSIILVQRAKVQFGTDGNATDVSSSAPLPTKEFRAATGTPSSVSGSATDVTILASNANRLGASIWNDSTANLYLLLASGTSSTSNFSVMLVPNAYFEAPAGYTGVIKGIWSAASGNARVTEFT